jgi:hypothetical protein
MILQQLCPTDSSFVGKTALLSSAQQLITIAKPNIPVILRHEGSVQQ